MSLKTQIIVSLGHAFAWLLKNFFIENGSCVIFVLIQVKEIGHWHS